VERPAGHEDDALRVLRPEEAELLVKVPAGPPRHVEVAHDDVERALAVQRQRRVDAARDLDLEVAQHALQRLEELRLVVDEQDATSIAIRGAIGGAIPRQIDRPRPVPTPIALVVKNDSKMRSRLAGSIPEPVSSISSVTSSPSLEARIRIS
jgi:hypothetical protein